MEGIPEDGRKDEGIGYEACEMFLYRLNAIEAAIIGRDVDAPREWLLQTINDFVLLPFRGKILSACVIILSRKIPSISVLDNFDRSISILDDPMYIVRFSER